MEIETRLLPVWPFLDAAGAFVGGVIGGIRSGNWGGAGVGAATGAVTGSTGIVGRIGRWLHSLF